MKKVILSLAILGSFGMIQAQNSFQLESAYAAVNDFEVSSALDVLNIEPVNDLAVATSETVENEYSTLDDNIEYLTEVQSPDTPNAVRKYQVMASLYDVTDSYIFDGRNEPFQMVFKTDKGTIRTMYNWKGEVLSSEEKFRDVALPNEVLRNVLKDYQGWQVIRTNYYVSYLKDTKAEKIYSVQITNGKKRKKISLDEEGAVL